MIIRTFRDSDAETVLACVAQLQDFEHAIDARCKEGSDVVARYFYRLQNECAEKAGKIFVAELDGKVVGYAVVLTKVRCDEADETDYDYALISDLAVLDEYRGQGLGRALLAAADSHAQNCGARWLRIGVLGKNQVARRVYENYGFEERYVELEKVLTHPD